jgi:transcriptional regulator with XRE-family HTH domain
MTEQDKIRLIFALKVKYMRLQRDLSYQELSDMTGLSTSYLHDIEKGKKYPKIAKINALASAFGVDYNEMVSTRASGKIQPIVDLLNSDFLKVFPLELFGLSLYKLFELFSNTPDKINAFISTIIKITRNYQLRNEHFYLAALRSFQEMHDNYFEDLELAVKRFREDNDLKQTASYTTDHLEKLLNNIYGITVERDSMPKNQELTGIRSFYSDNKKTIYLNAGLSSAQENFLLGRELAFQYLAIEERPYVTRIIEVNSFEKLLNNFRASYFSVALLMDEVLLTADLQSLMEKKVWQEDILLSLLKKYDVTPEMLFQRMTNILPKHFGVKDLFFLRLQGDRDLKRYRLSKELHLSQLHNPYGNVRNEHYCRRWISINIIKRLRAGRQQNPIADAQISRYWETPNEYLCLSIAKPDQEDKKSSVSVTIGVLLTDKVREAFHFLQDEDLKSKEVNTTCERCSMPNCGARVMPPVALEEEEARERIKAVVNQLDS